MDKRNKTDFNHDTHNEIAAIADSDSTSKKHLSINYILFICKLHSRKYKEEKAVESIVYKIFFFFFI